MKVVIVIPVLNGEEYLVDCVESCCQQTYKNTVVIIVDNQSDDETHRLSLSLQDRYENLRVYKNDVRLPMSDNWNEALRLARKESPELVKLMCADDLLHPKNIEYSVEEFKKDKNTTLVTSYEEYIGEKNGFRGSGFFPKCADSGGVVAQLLLKGNWIGCPSAVLFRDDRSTKFDNLIWVVDLKFWIDCLRKCSGRVKIVPDYLYKNRRHSGQITNSKTVAEKRFVEDIGLRVDGLRYIEGAGNYFLLMCMIAKFFIKKKVFNVFG